MQAWGDASAGVRCPIPSGQVRPVGARGGHARCRSAWLSSRSMCAVRHHGVFRGGPASDRTGSSVGQGRCIRSAV